mmetsp:Transcript_3646/g.9418  ORF Transcript_3646/g.9418 Transcript_3646/m.9418 type:complete len:89 (-) Transcript_3646:27-293(-)
MMIMSAMLMFIGVGVVFCAKDNPKPHHSKRSVRAEEDLSASLMSSRDASDDESSDDEEDASPAPQAAPAAAAPSSAPPRVLGPYEFSV